MFCLAGTTGNDCIAMTPSDSLNDDASMMLGDNHIGTKQLQQRLVIKLA